MTDIYAIQTDTLVRIWRLDTNLYSYAPITGITKAAPAVVTATAHGIPNGWNVAVVSVVGMTQINASTFPPIEPSFDDDGNALFTDYQPAVVIDANTVSLNLTNASGYNSYQSGGYLMFRTPQALAGYSAVFHITDPTTGLLLLDASSYVVVDSIGMSITLTIPAAIVAAQTWAQGNYTIQTVSGTGTTTTIDQGLIVLGTTTSELDDD